jgi:prephenate dehydrogenase
VKKYARAALIGTGMIGGSFARALKDAGVVDTFVGADRSRANLERARALGFVDESAGLAEAAGQAELVILAVPVRATEEVCAQLAPALAARPEVLVSDCGSTKVEVQRAVEAVLPFPERFVGAHPIAGTEKSGPDAAQPQLFRGRRCLVTPALSTRADKVAECAALWQAVGAETKYMDPSAHDQALAFVSHLPHAAAFALALAVGAVDAAGLSGGGFADTTRIAASDPVMWRDVFLANAGPVLAAIDKLEGALGELSRAIAAGDGAAIERLILRAHEGRAKILGSPR